MNTTHAGKCDVSVLVDIELLDEAVRMNVNIAEPLEQALRGLIRTEHEKRWLQENGEAIASNNAFVDRRGLLASRLRLRPQPDERLRS